MPFGPREALGELHVRFGAEQIALPAAPGERAGDDDAAGRRDARGRLAFVPDEHLKLIEQRRAEDRLLRVGDLLLAVFEVRSRARERRAAHAAILLALVLVTRPNRDRRLVAELMREAGRKERLPVRLRRDVLNHARQTEREHDRLLIVALVVPRKKKRRLAAVSRPARQTHPRRCASVRAVWSTQTRSAHRRPRRGR